MTNTAFDGYETRTYKLKGKHGPHEIVTSAPGYDSHEVPDARGSDLDVARLERQLAQKREEQRAREIREAQRRDDIAAEREMEERAVKLATDALAEQLAVALAAPDETPAHAPYAIRVTARKFLARSSAQYLAGTTEGALQQIANVQFQTERLLAALASGERRAAPDTAAVLDALESASYGALHARCVALVGVTINTKG